MKEKLLALLLKVEGERSLQSYLDARSDVNCCVKCDKHTPTVTAYGHGL